MSVYETKKKTNRWNIFDANAIGESATKNASTTHEAQMVGEWVEYV